MGENQKATCSGDGHLWTLNSGKWCRRCGRKAHDLVAEAEAQRDEAQARVRDLLEEGGASPPSDDTVTFTAGWVMTCPTCDQSVEVVCECCGEAMSDDEIREDLDDRVRDLNRNLDQLGEAARAALEFVANSDVRSKLSTALIYAERDRPRRPPHRTGTPPEQEEPG